MFDSIKFWHDDGMNYSLEEIEQMPPIVWYRNLGGNECIKVRNGSGEDAHVSRYSFLYTNVSNWEMRRGTKENTPSMSIYNVILFGRKAPPVPDSTAYTSPTFISQPFI